MQYIYDKSAEIKNVMYLARPFGSQLNVVEGYRKVKFVMLIKIIKDLYKQMIRFIDL